MLSSCEDLELYQGKCCLAAIAENDLALDNAKELLNYFGGAGSNKGCAVES